jgi:ElaB/YqjD/DUF883 family membrane-anchored ribosome-binding protein
MDRSTTMGGNSPLGGNANPPSYPAAKEKLEGAAQTAHQTVDSVANKATAQLDRLSGTAHKAVNSAADVASTAAEWASTLPEQAKEVQSKLTEVQTKFTESACASIRARPLSTVAGALVVGYLIGRLARI